MRHIFSLMILGIAMMGSGTAEAACRPRLDEFDDRASCERRHRFCEYNSRVGCYTPSNESGRCERRNDEYNDRSDCERRHNRCEYNSRIGCYVPERGGGGGGRPTTTTTSTTTTTTQPSSAHCRDDGSYFGNGYKSKDWCEASYSRQITCSQQGDGCWHPYMPTPNPIVCSDQGSYTGRGYADRNYCEHTYSFTLQCSLRQGCYRPNGM